MKVIGLILLAILVGGAIYSFIIWIANQLDLAGIFSRSGPTVKEAEPQLTLKKEDRKVEVEFEKPSGLQLKKDIPAGFTAAHLSPYFGKVEITSLRRPTSAGTGGGFTLQADFTLNELLDITNWRIKSNKSELTIKGGSSDIPPVNLKRIILRPRTSAVFYTDINSFVKNVELNKCTGYLNNTYNFSPKLPTNCPRPERSDFITFSGECQSFIQSLSSCEQPTSAELNRFTRPSDISCHEFLESLNYGNCVREHSADPDFYSYGWRIWMSEKLPFDPRHDRLLLFDENGLIVDEYIY